MSVMSDKQIKKLAEECGMIDPFYSNLVDKDSNGDKIISHGLSSYGYDVKIAPHFFVFKSFQDSKVTIDPKSFSKEDVCSEIDDDFCIIPPNGFALGHTVERFKVPRDIMIICVGKSTYARCGIIVNVTPIEPEFEGQVVIEFSNTTQLPVKIYANEGGCQFIFLKTSDSCEVSYRDRKGKYFGQSGITLPTV